MDYYHKKLFIPQVDRDDNIIGQIERWEAHKKAILHRGFTTVLIYQDKLISQHRKHPVFNGYFDISFSSHQIYKGNLLQPITEAIIQTLKREWYIENHSKIEPKLLGKYYYKKKDPNSQYSEHEINYLYSIKIDEIPSFNPLYAYGMSILDKAAIKNKQFPLSRVYAPWVDKLISLL